MHSLFLAWFGVRCSVRFLCVSFCYNICTTHRRSRTSHCCCFFVVVFARMEVDGMYGVYRTVLFCVCLSPINVFVWLYLFDTKMRLTHSLTLYMPKRYGRSDMYLCVVFCIELVSHCLQQQQQQQQPETVEYETNRSRRTHERTRRGKHTTDSIIFVGY